MRFAETERREIVERVARTCYGDYDTMNAHFKNEVDNVVLDVLDAAKYFELREAALKVLFKIGRLERELEQDTGVAVGDRPNAQAARIAGETLRAALKGGVSSE